MVEKKRHRGME